MTWFRGEFGDDIFDLHLMENNASVTLGHVLGSVWVCTLHTFRLKQDVCGY